MHRVYTVHVLAMAVFPRSIKVLGWQPRAPNPREHEFPKKMSLFFEIHRTIDTFKGSVALAKHAFGR